MTDAPGREGTKEDEHEAPEKRQCAGNPVVARDSQSCLALALALASERERPWMQVLRPVPRDPEGSTRDSDELHHAPGPRLSRHIVQPRQSIQQGNIAMQLERTFQTALLITSMLLFPVMGCSDLVYARGADTPGLDDPAMGTGMDRRDMEKLLDDNMKDLLASPVANKWDAETEKSTLAIFPMANETGEHIDSQLQALLSNAESLMVKSQLVTVVSRERQNRMIKEVEREHNPQFDPQHINAYGRQLGVKYYMTGKVYDADERNGDERRVQYFLSMQVIETATSAIVWDHSTGFTKAIIRD